MHQASGSSRRKEPIDRLRTIGPAGTSTDGTVESRSHSKAAAKEARRIRGEIACAECRRLKIRCDRQVPCSTCVSRGCAALCPNGVLPPGDNSRFVESAKDHLQKRLKKMEDHMRALEDAISIAQSLQSDQTHALLATPFKYDDDIDEEDTAAESPEADEIADTFGTLHIDEKDNTVRFFGPTGGSESLLLDDIPKTEADLRNDITPLSLRALGLPEELDIFFNSFPFTPVGVPTAPARRIVESFLPQWDRATALCRTFMEHLSWMFQIVTLNYLTEELMPTIYTSINRTSPGPNTLSAHDLALFYIVLSIGSLVDLSMPPYNAEAQRYYSLARTAVCLQSVMESNSLATVKLLHLISIYNGMSGRESNMANSYALLNFAGRLAQKIGLHADPSYWHLDEKAAYERRSYFWNLLAADLWQSLGTGRPPALASAHINCRIPTEAEERSFQRGEITQGFGVWGFRYSQECLMPVVRIALAAKPALYQDVLELDRKIRSLVLPKSEDSEDSPSISASMNAWVRSHYTALMLMFLHRGFFAQAMTTHPNNPMDSPYRHSFLTCYYCACSVVDTTRDHFRRHPQLLSRVWQIWSFMYWSSVIVGAVASRAPHLNLDPPPLLEFDEACAVFRSASQTNSRAAKALPVLLNMREQAMQLQRSSSSYAAPSKHDEVAVFGGQTRLVESARAVQPVPSGSAIQMTHAQGPPHPAQVGTFGRSREMFPPPAGPSRPSTQPIVPSQPFHYYSTAAGPVPGQWVISDFAGPEGVSEPADFILDDSWSSFMQHYGTLPQTRTS